MNAAPEQLELFTVIPLPPCGRNLGPCEAFVEIGQLRCIRCGCVAPRVTTAFANIFDGFIAAQLNSLQEQENSAPDASPPATPGI